MAISEAYSGSASYGTSETTLNTTTPETTDGIYQLFVDVSAMAAGDIYVFRIKEKARSGDTQRLLFAFTLSHAQLEPLWCSPALILMHGWDMTIQRSAGSDRTLNWSIRKVA